MPVVVCAWLFRSRRTAFLSATKDKFSKAAKSSFFDSEAGTPIKSMKKLICILASAALFGACEQKTTTVNPPAEKKTENNTTVVNPTTEKKTESNTTVVNPTTEKKTESNTTILQPSSEKKTESTTTTTTSSPNPN